MTACSSSSCLSCLPGRPLAETCVVCGRTPPRFFFFVISGSACNGIQLAIDRLLALALPEGRWWVPTLCWTLSYAMSISFRFVSHAAVVFGPHRDPPLLALGKTYLTYMSTIVASTAINLALVAGGGVTHELALAPTAIFSVVWSYVALSYTWAGEGKRSCCQGRPDGHGRRWYLPRYRAVESQATEEHTPCSKRSQPVVSSLSSAVWLQPETREWAGLPSSGSLRSQRAESAGSSSCELLPVRLSLDDTMLGAGAGSSGAEPDLLHPPDLLAVAVDSPPPLRPIDGAGGAASGCVIAGMVGDEAQGEMAPCSPRPVAMPR